MVHVVQVLDELLATSRRSSRNVHATARSGSRPCARQNRSPYTIGTISHARSDDHVRKTAPNAGTLLSELSGPVALSGSTLLPWSDSKSVAASLREPPIACSHCVQPEMTKHALHLHVHVGSLALPDHELYKVSSEELQTSDPTSERESPCRALHWMPERIGSAMPSNAEHAWSLEPSC